MSNKLTDDQIAELAPDWATHYIIIDNDITPSCIAFYDGFWHQWFYHKDKNNWSPKLTYSAIPKSAKTIPSKKLDIGEHKFSDSTIEYDSKDDDTLYLETSEFISCFRKHDAIAIAKHFNLTADDLK